VRYKKMSKRIRTLIIIFLTVVALLIIAGVIIVNLPSSTTANNLSAKLSELVGVVQARDNPQTDYNPVDDGFVLKTVMQLQTKEESRVRLDLSTGSILRLGQLTLFSLDPPTPQSGGVLSQIELQVGKVWIVLKGGSLDVNTPGGLASVRGSYMSVWVEKNTNKITVCCLEGSCAFQNPAGAVELTSGQKVISSDPNLAPSVVPMDMLDIQDWNKNSPESAVVIPQTLSLLGLTAQSSAPSPTLMNTLAASPTPPTQPESTLASSPTPPTQPESTLASSFTTTLDPANLLASLPTPPPEPANTIMPPTDVGSTSYEAYVGSLATNFTKGDICSLEAPFTLEGNYDVISSNLIANFTPTSATTGDYIYTFNIQDTPCDFTSEGTYQVNFYSSSEAHIFMTGVATLVCEGITIYSDTLPAYVAIREAPGLQCP
jgi:hypothetical protein